MAIVNKKDAHSGHHSLHCPWASSRMGLVPGPFTRPSLTTLNRKSTPATRQDRETIWTYAVILVTQGQFRCQDPPP